MAISGSTGGIGRQLCLSLSRLGANIICLDRNAEKVKELARELTETDVRHILCDLSDMQSVHRAADELEKADVDVLILCAGAYHIPRVTCDSGYDNIFQINFLAPYYLAARMKPHLLKRGGKVVTVSSLSVALTRFDPEDPEKATGNAVTAYGNAKRCLLFSLSSLYDGSDALSLTHPGISPTGITSGYPRLIKAAIKYPMKLVFMSPKKASNCVLRGVFQATERGKWIGPRILGIWGKPKLTEIKSYNDRESDIVFRWLKNNF